MMLLAGDIGGTKARIAHFSRTNGVLKRGEMREYRSADFPSLGAILKEFLGAVPPEIPVAAACFGVPGPVSKGQVKITNLPWELRETELQSVTGIPRVRLVNDLVATAAAIPTFTDADLTTLHAGDPNRDRSTCAVVAPGTGLGHALLSRQGDTIQFLPSEGGHASFAPTNDEEIALLQYLIARGKPVSVEHVICGPGLVNIYSFLRDTNREKEPAELKERMEAEPPAIVISKAGLANEFPICAKALALFARLLGSHAGNIALTFLSLGGVYLGGGIPPKLAAVLTTGETVTAYKNKSKLAHVLEATPLYIIQSDLAAVNGAGYLANLEVR